MKKTNRFIALLTALVLVFSTMINTVAFAAVNPDVTGTDFEVAVAKLKAVGVMEGYPDGTFKPEGEITRAEFAKIAVVAMGLGDAAEASKGVTKFGDVTASHWASGYINLAVNRGLVAGYPDGTYKPDGKLTNAEAITILCRMVGLGPVIDKEGTWPANYVGRASNEGLLKGVNVASGTNALRGLTAKMLVNTLTADMWGATTYKTDGTVEYGKTGDTLLGDKLNVTEYNKDMEDADGAKLFDEVRVVAIDTDDNTITLEDAQNAVGIDTFDIAEGMDVDAYELYMNEVTAWVNDDDEVIYANVESDYYLDAIEYSAADDELTIVTADKTFDITAAVAANANVNNATAAGLAATNYQLAKVVLDDKGDVAYVDAYTMTDFAVVESVDGDGIVTVDGTEVDFEDYRIFKDGKLADVADMVKGDIVTFNTVASGDIDGFAEIFTKSVTGPIDKTYAELFKVKGVEYDYSLALKTSDTVGLNAQYVNEDGDLDDMDIDAADQFKAEGDVTVFVDRAGEAMFVTGELGELATNDIGGILTEAVTQDSSFGKSYLELTFVNQSGKKVTETVKVEDLDMVTVDGTEYEVGEDCPNGITADSEIDKLTMFDDATPNVLGDVILAKNEAGTVIQAAGPVDLEIFDYTDLVADMMVTFTYDDNGDVVGLEFYDANEVAIADEIDVADDDFADGNKIMSDTLVFDISDGTDEGDTVVTKWSDIKTIETIKTSTIYVNDDSEVVYIVTDDTDAAADTTYIALIEDSLTNGDGDTTQITAWVKGASKDYDVDELGAVVSGQVYQITVNEDELVTKILTIDGTGTVDTAVDFNDDDAIDADDDILEEDLTIADDADVNTSDKLITIGGVDYKLDSSAKIYNRLDGEDIEVKTLLQLKSEITDNQNLVTMILSTPDAVGNRYVQMIIVTDEANAAGDTY